jgi:class 3 adenylate cyclase/predicted ATPase
MTADIANWLLSLGLQQYEEAFRDNDIDPSVLGELTADDLVGLGVASIGHRRKLLGAIARLRDPEARASSSTESVRFDPVEHPRTSHEAERRQLTVMFVDLAGSTALSARFDPEDMRTIITDYQNAVAGVVMRYEGQVAKYMGDGIFCHFGWPVAHEDDTERALRAALAIVSAMKELKAPDGQGLQARIGIATGLVVIGDLIGTGAAQEEAVVGETPNLAARLQAFAAPGKIMIAEATRRRVGSLFNVLHMGAQEFKGFAGPVPAYQLLDERAAESRYDARSSGLIPAMVGRDHELALVVERWRRAKSREGQMVVLSGEAGIGKSRVTRAIIDAVAPEPHIRLSYQCSPFYSDSPLYPIAQQLTFASGIKADDSIDDKLDRLEGILVGAKEHRPLIASLMGLDSERRYGVVNMTPQQQRGQTLQALVGQLIALAEQKPVLFVLEDAHWIDATTLELVDLCLDQIAHARVMMLVTARPTFQHNFGGHPIVTKLALNRLGRDQIVAIVSRLTGGKTLPNELLDVIAAKTDGMPLFVEEFTKSVLESGELKETDSAFELTGPLDHLTIPSTLYDSLMARLDRLQPIKEVAQTAACIGRDFSYGLLKAVSPLDYLALQDALERLVKAELIFQRGAPPEASYTFKHALVRDAAYDTLLKTRRQKIHASLVDAFEGIDAVPELIAHHATIAGIHEKAIDHWLMAGERASQQSADVEAVRHLRRGMNLLADIPEGPLRDGKELSLRIALGGPLIATRGYAFSETAENYARARELCERLGERDRLLPVLYGEYAAHYVHGDLREMRSTAALFASLCEEQDQDGVNLIVKRFSALDHFHTGDPLAAKQLLEDILASYVPERHQGLAINFGHDARVSSLSYLGWALWVLGYPEQAELTSAAAVKWGRGLSHANSKGLGLGWGATMTKVLLRDADSAAMVARELIEYSDTVGLSLWSAYGRVYSGWAKMAQGHCQDARREMLTGLAMLEQTGNRRNSPLLFSWAAQAEMLNDNSEEAANWLRKGFVTLEATDDSIWAPELYRTRAELALQFDGDPKAAELDYLAALDLARQQHSKMFELRAATGLARQWSLTGRRVEARDLLQPVYGWFTEGFATADLADARSLLKKLA